MSSTEFHNTAISTKDVIPTSILTPPSSPGYNEYTSHERALVSISTTFTPGAETQSSPTDLILVSSDSVLFYVHTNVLLSASRNKFASLLPADSVTKDSEAIVSVSDSSDVLNIVLHTLYDLCCAHYFPSLSSLVDAIDALKAYGVDLESIIHHTTPLFSLLLAHAPASPLDVFALAAHHGLEELAVSSSHHLLSLSLYSISDEITHTIGPIYLKRLFFLHLGRSDALKAILLPPPHPHPPTFYCDFAQQKKLTRAWALASAYLAWEARPDMVSSTLQSVLTPLVEHLLCDECRRSLQERISSLISQWSSVKRTI